MKKRFTSILLCFIVATALFIFPMTVNAEEPTMDAVESVEIETMAEAPAPEHETTAPEAPSSAGSLKQMRNTLFTRIWEFFCSYSNETISVGGSTVLSILFLVLRHSTSKSSKESKREMKSIKGMVTETNESQTEVESAVNNMIDGYNEMKAAYDLYGSTDGERNRIVGAVLATNTAILEILTTVYVNSKNLPQGVKDIVNLKYANCLKTLEDDKKLIAIVEAVRNNISTTSANTEDATDRATEAAEV